MARGALPSKRSKALIAHAQQTVSLGLLSQAGVDARLIKRAVQRIDQALDAKVTKRIKLRSDEVLTFHDIDHRTRLSAADRVLDVGERASIVPSKSTVDAGSGPSIQVVVRLADGSTVAVGVGKHG